MVNLIIDGQPKQITFIEIDNRFYKVVVADNAGEVECRYSVRLMPHSRENVFGEKPIFLPEGDILNMPLWVTRDENILKISEAIKKIQHTVKDAG